MIELFSSLANWTLGSFVIIDLIAASTNAFNGAILANRKDHHRKWTVVGIILIAVIGGIGGGVTRDVLLNDVPSAFKNPWYMLLCLVAAILALLVTRSMSHESEFARPSNLWRPSHCPGMPSSARRKRLTWTCRSSPWS